VPISGISSPVQARNIRPSSARPAWWGVAPAGMTSPQSQ